MMSDIILAEFLDNESIFKRIQSLNPYPFFDTYSPEQLDELLIYNFGERLVYYKIISLSLDSVANLIYTQFNDSWLNMINIQSFNIADGNIKTVTENTVNNSVSTGSNNNTHKVSAFNDVELIDDYSDVGNNTNTNDGKGEKIVTEKNKTLQGVYNNLLLTQKVNIMNTVIKNVANTLTLDIY